jgi:hypothetical protein
MHFLSRNDGRSAMGNRPDLPRAVAAVAAGLAALATGAVAGVLAFDEVSPGSPPTWTLWLLVVSAPAALVASSVWSTFLLVRPRTMHAGTRNGVPIAGIAAEPLTSTGKLSVRCAACGLAGTVSAGRAGTTLPCPRCKAPVSVPRPTPRS